MNDDNGKRKSRKVLLVFQIAVNGQQYVESLCCELEEESVLTPAHPASATVLTS